MFGFSEVLEGLLVVAGADGFLCALMEEDDFFGEGDFVEEISDAVAEAVEKTHRSKPISKRNFRFEHTFWQISVILGDNREGLQGSRQASGKFGGVEPLQIGGRQGSTDARRVTLFWECKS